MSEHYTDDRRWSFIHNAWILKSSWNDREELACMTHAAEAVRLENVKLREQNEALQRELHDLKNHFTEDSLRGRLQVVERERDELKAVLQALNKDGLSDAVMNAIIENTELKRQVEAMRKGIEQESL